MDFNVDVFTLNCWGIPGISKNRKERFDALIAYLRNSSHNIVCLQEVWSEQDYLHMKEKLYNSLPYGHYFYSGVFGSGLCVFSKWVIYDVFFYKWPLNGYIHKIHHGDWFGGKGIGLCRLKCQDRMINVYNAHLHAQYHEDDIYLAHRMLQAYSTAEFVKLTSASADLCVLAGDLNTAPGDLSYRIITQLSYLQDPFEMDYEESDPHIRKELGTVSTANNSYSDINMILMFPDGKRIDHIFFRTDPNWTVTIKKFGNPLEDRVPGQPFSYSDHNAVCLELKLKEVERKVTRRASTQDDFQETLKEAIKVCEEATATISKTRTMYLTLGGFLFMFLIGSYRYWQNYLIFDVIKFFLTAVCFYSLLMGSLWNKIEYNSLKAGLLSLQNINRSRFGNKHS